MGIWNWLLGEGVAAAITEINPGTGLPMVGDIGGVDVGGNPYGLDLNQCNTDRQPALGAVTFEMESGIDVGWPD